MASKLSKSKHRSHRMTVFIEKKFEDVVFISALLDVVLVLLNFSAEERQDPFVADSLICSEVVGLLEKVCWKTCRDERSPEPVVI